MNSLPMNETLEYGFKMIKFLYPLNDLLKEAYAAGVRDINVFITKNDKALGDAPMIHIDLYERKDL